MKRTNFLFVMLLIFITMLMVMAGCGGEKTSPAGDIGKEAKSEEVKDKPSKPIEIKSGEIEAKFSDDVKKSVSLPDGYPDSNFPIYKDSFVSAVQSDDKSFVIVCFSKDKVSDVTAFYKNLLKDAMVYSETEDEKGFVSMGVKDGYSYTICTNESDEIDDYPTTFIITLMTETDGMENLIKMLPNQQSN